jgi:hypothetical protein
MANTVRLHARPGLARLHIDEHEHEVGPDGTVVVPHHQMEAALSLGCSRTPIAPAGTGDDPLAALEARVAALEAEVAVLKGGKKR